MQIVLYPITIITLHNLNVLNESSFCPLNNILVA